MRRWTEAELQQVLDRRQITAVRKAEIAAIGGKARSNKYHNVPTVVNGLRFDSRKEADYYRDLSMLKAAGEIRGFTRQVSLPLPSGKRRMRIDFVIVESDGRVRWVDVKGITTREWSLRRDEVQHALGIQIETI